MTLEFLYFVGGIPTLITSAYEFVCHREQLIDHFRKNHNDISLMLIKQYYWIFTVITVSLMTCLWPIMVFVTCSKKLRKLFLSR